MTFLLYCICGGIGVSTDYVTFYLLVTAGAWYQSANIAGYIAGTLVSFALNRAFTFKMKDKVGRRLATFLLVGAIGYACSAILLWLLVKGAHLDPRLAKVVTLPLVVAVQYSLNRRFSFRTTALPAGPIA
jgi:putative flippase GtrA